MDSHSSGSGRATAVYFGASFALHFAWEVAQMPLFTVEEMSFWASIRMCLYATATGDMLFMALLFALVAVVHRRWTWIADRTAYAHPATWLIPVAFGILLAIGYELWAVHVIERWEYGQMPIVPYIKVGLAPVLQMILIPLAALGLCRTIAK